MRVFIKRSQFPMAYGDRPQHVPGGAAGRDRASGRLNESILWIDWGCHRRTRSLCQRLAVELLEIPKESGGVERYLRSSRRTIATIKSKRPQVVIATNPSLVLAYLLLLLRPLLGFRLVSDAHYFGVIAPRGSPLVQRMLDAYNARADLVIVTNENHARRVVALGGRAFVCEDPLPELTAGVATSPEASKSVFLISSFDEDEPYEEVFRAVEGLVGEGYVLSVSGDFAKAGIEPSRYPAVRFMGFMEEDDYYAALRAADVVVDLTTVEDCLVCGAYEAISLRKPLVVSRTRALGHYFGSAAVLTENESHSIAAAIVYAYQHADELTRKAGDWVARNEPHMEARIASLRAMLASDLEVADEKRRAQAAHGDELRSPGGGS